MGIPIFLSYPKPYVLRQEVFIKKIIEYLKSRGLEEKTLGVSEYDMKAPLTAIRRLLLESNGLITVAFRRSLIEGGKCKPDSDNGNIGYDLSKRWLTSAYCQIEPAMAFQIGLPIIILREKGVVEDGILEKGVSGIYLPEFDLSEPIDAYFKTKEWLHLVSEWEGYVRRVVETKGNPPKLY